MRRRKRKPTEASAWLKKGSDDDRVILRLPKCEPKEHSIDTEEARELCIDLIEILDPPRRPWWAKVLGLQVVVVE